MSMVRRAFPSASSVVLLLALAWPAAAESPTTQPARPWLSILRAGREDLLAELQTDPADDPDRGRDRWAVIEAQRRAREAIERPGPPPAGKFDHEVLHWMDVESFGEFKSGAGYRARHYFGAAAGRRGGDLAFTQHELVVRAFEEALGITATQAFLKARVLDLHKRPRLPRASGPARRFPGQLVDLQVSGMVPIVYLYGQLSVAFGSASDKPFAGDHEMVADITWATGSFAGGQDHSLVFFINWQNNRDFLNAMPIPGLVYRRKHLDTFMLVTGFPYQSVAWRPSERVELSASYVFPRTVHSEASFRAADNLRLRAGFDWTNQRYYLHDRREVRDRLWYDEKRLSAGLRWHLREHVFLDVGGGWAFDRSWWEGRTLQDTSGRLRIDDGPFVGIQLHARF